MESDLPETALPSWNAFQAMEQSKRQYFSCLEQLERKYENGGTRLLTEEVELESLLAIHDRRVADFSQSVKTLGIEDSEAHKALIARMAAFAASLRTDET